MLRHNAHTFQDKIPLNCSNLFEATKKNVKNGKILEEKYRERSVECKRVKCELELIKHPLFKLLWSHLMSLFII